MDATAGMSPSMETIAAGLAGFTLASILSLTRKPQAVKKELPPTSYMAVGASLNSSIPTNTPVINFPGMGHDFHMLARLVAEKQHPLTLPTTAGGAEESMLQILRNFHPQLTELSSFEWRANLNGHKNYPNASEMVGRNTYITYAANSQSQPLRLTSTSSMGPGWMQGNEYVSENIMAELEAYRIRPVEEMPEESRDGQRGQRRRKCCGRDKDDEARRSHRSWYRSRDEDASPAGRGRWGPREDYRDRWGWSRYREEGQN